MTKAREIAELGAVYDSGALSNRNLIINGAMQVAQRGTSTTAETGSGYKTCDRFFIENNGSTYDVEQSSDAPDGFQYSQKVTADGAFSASGTDFLIPFEYRMEGNDLQRLGYGTSSAKTMTLSFWIKSNKTGTYVVNLVNNNPTQRGQSQSYTVDASDTWEYKTLVYTGDTSVAFEGGVTSELTLFWWMVTGPDYSSGTLATSWENLTSANRAVGVSSSCADNDYWQITGVQLEVGPEATPFEHRSYGDELARCQRYFERLELSDQYRLNGIAWSADSMNISVPFMVKKRAAPTTTIASDGEIFTGSWVSATSSEVTGATADGATINIKKTSGYTVKYGYFIRYQDLKFDAEL